MSPNAVNRNWRITVVSTTQVAQKKWRSLLLQASPSVFSSRFGVFAGSSVASLPGSIAATTASNSATSSSASCRTGVDEAEREDVRDGVDRRIERQTDIPSIARNHCHSRVGDTISQRSHDRLKTRVSASAKCS